MRDFSWDQDLWIVIKDDGRYAGVPCLSWSEAFNLSQGHPGSKIFKIARDD